MKLTFSKMLLMMILMLAAIFFLFPIVLTVTNSIMSPFEVYQRYTREVTPSNRFSVISAFHYVEISLIPKWISFNQYMELFTRRPLYLKMFFNSINLAVPIVVGQVIIAAPTAYVFEYSKLKLKEAVYFVYIIIMLLPAQVNLVPNFIAASMVGLEESSLAIILPAIFSPFGVFLVRQFMKGIPYEYIEAAEIDGASNVIVFASIILPLVKSAIAALVVLSFVENWNIIDQAIIFIRDPVMEPLSVYLSTITTGDTGMIFATSCFYMVPPILVFLFGEEYMIEGIQLSGIK